MTDPQEADERARAIAELLGAHGAARYADTDTLTECLGGPDPYTAPVRDSARP